MNPPSYPHKNKMAANRGRFYRCVSYICRMWPASDALTLEVEHAVDTHDIDK